MTRTWKFLLAAVAAACLVLAAWIVIHEGRTPQNEREALNRMIELQNAGRYDKAARVVKTWMNDSRRDISHDYVLYDQIAMVYIAKAYREQASRDESVQQAELNLEKALALYDRQGSQGINVELSEIGGAFEALGDVSGKNKCQFYDKARQAFVRQLPLIKGDSYTAYGKTIPLEPVRAAITKHLDAVNEKYSRAACRTQ